MQANQQVYGAAWSASRQVAMAKTTALLKQACERRGMQMSFGVQCGRPRRAGFTEPDRGSCMP